MPQLTGFFRFPIDGAVFGRRLRCESFVKSKRCGVERRLNLVHITAGQPDFSPTRFVTGTWKIWTDGVQ